MNIFGDEYAAVDLRGQAKDRVRKSYIIIILVSRQNAGQSPALVWPTFAAAFLHGETNVWPCRLRRISVEGADLRSGSS